MELLVTVTIISIMTYIMIPGFSEIRASFDRSDARRQILLDIRRVQSEASSQGARGIIVIENAGESYSVGVDYEPFNDPPDYDTELYKRNLPNLITLSVSQDLLFDPRGYLIDSDGELTSSNVAIYHESAPVYSANVYPTGALSVVY